MARGVGQRRAGVRALRSSENHCRAGAHARAAAREARARRDEGARRVRLRRARGDARARDAHVGRAGGRAAQGLRRRQPARGGVRRQRRPRVEHEPDHGSGRSVGGPRGRDHQRRGGTARGSTLDGRGRVHLDAVAARDVRIPDRARARRARRVPGGRSRGTRAHLQRARHGSRGGAAHHARPRQEPRRGARRTRARGAGPEPGRPRLAVGRGDLLVPRLLGGSDPAAAAVLPRPSARSAPSLSRP